MTSKGPYHIESFRIVDILVDHTLNDPKYDWREWSLNDADNLEKVATMIRREHHEQTKNMWENLP